MPDCVADDVVRAWHAAPFVWFLALLSCFPASTGKEMAAHSGTFALCSASARRSLAKRGSQDAGAGSADPRTSLLSPRPSRVHFRVNARFTRRDVARSAQRHAEATLSATAVACGRQAPKPGHLHWVLAPPSLIRHARACLHTALSSATKNLAAAAQGTSSRNLPHSVA